MSDDRAEVDGEVPQCDHRDCAADAIGIYEGVDPPARTVRYASCTNHAPDVQPINWVGDQLVTDGGVDQSGDGTERQ